MKQPALVVLPLLLTGLTACGSAESSDSRGQRIDAPAPVAACEQTVTPCGGDPVGVWNQTSDCLSEPVIHPYSDCPEAAITTTHREYQETVDLHNDGSGSLDVVLAVESTWQVPTLCLAEEDATCADLESHLRDTAEHDVPRGIAVDVACDVRGPDCDCEVQAVGAADGLTLDWAVVGNQLVITTDDGSSAASDFCVDGDTFSISNGLGVATYVRMTPPPTES